MNFFYTEFTEVNNRKSDTNAFTRIAILLLQTHGKFLVNRTSGFLHYSVAVSGTGLTERKDSAINMQLLKENKESVGAKQYSKMNLHGHYLFHRRDMKAERSHALFTTFHLPEIEEVKQVKDVLPSKKSNFREMGHRCCTSFPWLQGTPPLPLSPAGALSSQPQTKERQIQHHILKWGHDLRQESPATQWLILCCTLDSCGVDGGADCPFLTVQFLHSYGNFSRYHNLAVLIFYLCRFVAYLSCLGKAIYLSRGIQMCTPRMQACLGMLEELQRNL